MTIEEAACEFTFEEEATLYEQEARQIFATEEGEGDAPGINNVIRRGMRIIRKAREQISALRAQQEAEKNEPFKWTFVKDHLPECEKGCEVGPVLFCTKHFVEVGYYGRGGKYRDSYFRIYTDAGEGIDSEYVIAWAWVSSLNPPKEAHNV